jgi:hypothetical protein
MIDVKHNQTDVYSSQAMCKTMATRIGGISMMVQMAECCVTSQHKEADVNELCVLHDCDQYYENNDISYRQCVNPDHLFLGTVQDNIQDCIKKGRYVKPPSYRGADNYNAKLTEKQVLWVIEQHHKITQVKLGEILNVNTSTIEMIHRGITWKHLPR